MKTPIKAIVWDLDGTLIHFKINFIRARRNAIKILRKHGIPQDKLSVNMSILDNIKSAIKIFKLIKLDKDAIKQIIKEVDKAVIEIEHKAALKASKIDGMEEILLFAQRNNLKQAIFTFNTENNARLSLETAGLLDFFELIVGRDNIANPKPHPDHLEYICKKLNVNPSDIVVIGDTSRDIEAALNVGARSIAVNTYIPKYFKKDTFKKADVIIEPNELPSKLIKTLEKLL